MGLLVDLRLKLGQYYFNWRCEILPVSESVKEALADLVNCEAERSGVVALEREFDHGPRLQVVLVRDKIVLTLVHEETDCGTSEKLNEILKVDKEAPVFLIFTVDLFPSLSRPQL